MENIIYGYLQAIFGEKMPKTATSFHTADGTACFLMGKTGKWRYVKMTPEQIEALRAKQLLGSFGWALK